MLLKIFNGLTDRLNFLGLFIRYGYIELFLKLHDQLNGVERVGAQILNEVGFRLYFAFIYTQFVSNDFCDTFGYACHIFLTLGEKNAFFEVQRNGYPGF